jgi:flagellar basal-body rod modification protein FlgD
MDNGGFMSLLLAQLRNQNPLEPMQDKDMMAQFTQLNSLQELQKMESMFEQMSTSNQLGNAAGLIGKSVKVAGDDGEDITGVVTGVTFSGGKIMLNLGDKQVPLDSLISVTAGDQGGS